MKAIQCHYCDQLHQVTADDRLQRLGRLYYMKECPVVTDAVSIVPESETVALP